MCLYLGSTEGLSGAAWAHGRRVMGPLLPARMAPTKLAASANLCWSLVSTFLVVVVTLGVAGVTPGRARGRQELVESWGRRGLRVSHRIALVVVGSSHSCGSPRWLRLDYRPPCRRSRGIARGVDGIALAWVGRPAWEGPVAVKVVVGKAVVV